MRSCERMMTATAADVAWQACCLFPHATLLESQHCQLLALWVRSDAWGGLDHQEVDSNGCFVSLNVTIIFVFCFSRFTSSKCPGAMAVQKAFTDATASSSTFRWVSVQVWARVTVSKGPNALKAIIDAPREHCRHPIQSAWKTPHLTPKIETRSE